MADRIIYENKKLGLRVVEWIYIKNDGDNEGQGQFYVNTLVGEFGFSWDFDYGDGYGYGIKLSSQHYIIPLDSIDIKILNEVRQAIMNEYNLSEWKDKDK